MCKTLGEKWEKSSRIRRKEPKVIQMGCCGGRGAKLSAGLPSKDLGKFITSRVGESPKRRRGIRVSKTELLFLKFKRCKNSSNIINRDHTKKGRRLSRPNE